MHVYYWLFVFVFLFFFDFTNLTTKAVSQTSPQLLNAHVYASLPFFRCQVINFFSRFRIFLLPKPPFCCAHSPAASFLANYHNCSCCRQKWAEI